MHVDTHELEALLRRAAASRPHLDVHKIETKAKEHVLYQAHRVVRAAHSKVVAISREYCHLVYFVSVFFEGHGIYSWVGGALFILSIAALIPGGADEFMEEI